MAEIAQQRPETPREAAPPLTEAELAEIAIRAKQATPGPWITRERSRNFGDGPEVITAKGFFSIAPVKSWEHETENATFIAAAREDIPRLLATIRHMQAERAALDAMGDAAVERARIVKQLRSWIANGRDGMPDDETGLTDWLATEVEESADE